jgi:hypothetical protein
MSSNNTDIIDDLYDTRDKAWNRVLLLRKRIAKDTAELAVQEARAEVAERSAELLCASDLFPMCRPNNPPKESGLVRLDKG